MEERIYVIGDSHVFFFSGPQNKLRRKPFYYGINVPQLENQQFQIFHLGPCLAYNLNRYNTHTKCREKIDFLLDSIISNGSTLITSFGEIDIRCHIPKYLAYYDEREREREREREVVKVTKEYIKFLKYISQNHNIIVFLPIGTGKDYGKIDKNFPAIGSEIERNICTHIFAGEIEHFSDKETNISCFNILRFMTINYETCQEFISDDNCHLNFSKFDFIMNMFRRQFF